MYYLSSQPVSAKGRSPSASQAPGAALPGFRLREAWRRSHSRAGGGCRTAGGQESTAVTRRIETATGTSIQPQSAVKEMSAGSGWPPGTARRGRQAPLRGAGTPRPIEHPHPRQSRLRTGIENPQCGVYIAVGLLAVSHLQKRAVQAACGCGQRQDGSSAAARHRHSSQHPLRGEKNCRTSGHREIQLQVTLQQTVLPRRGAQ